VDSGTNRDPPAHSDDNGYVCADRDGNADAYRDADPSTHVDVDPNPHHNPGTDGHKDAGTDHDRSSDVGTAHTDLDHRCDQHATANLDRYPYRGTFGDAAPHVDADPGSDA
jgi:hypothetical protein